MPKASGKAIVSLVCGILFLFLPLAIMAIVFGHLSLSEIKRSAGRLGGRGMAIAGLVLGYAGLAIIPVLILAAIAIPNLLRARLVANEASAANSVRVLNLAEVRYATEHPDRGFSCNLSDLGLDGGLATGRKHGYAFVLQNCAPRDAGGPNVKFQVLAIPEQRNTTGTRVFCTDESFVLKYDANASPEQCLEFGTQVR